MNDVKRIRSVFCEALDIETQQARDAYLEDACGDDSALRGEVDALLASTGQADDFFSGSMLSPDVSRAEVSEAPGTIIGRYKLLEKIGEGGMAVVYMAEQERPIRRKLALKIIKLGMDTKSVIARFEAERQALAIMDHPNIAKVIDAGATETGRPYFVMELVRGVSITEYCDANKLSPRKRLDLFVQVCDAVQHAHQKGIIHRDIKPSNIMVTLHNGRPTPKVIDFGIAKATDQRLTEKTLFTRYAQMIGTPAYMSPEQAEFSEPDVDTRSDIYSLGVLLYELLTGVTPFDAEKLRKAAYLEIQRMIREEEPLKPSTRLSTMGDMLTGVAESRGTEPAQLSRLVRGDLDWMVMKALEKDRTLRYDSASAFADDIKRYVNREPVAAGPHNLMYRARRFVRRRARLVAVSMVVVAAITAGLAIGAGMYVRAERARAAMTISRIEAESITGLLNDLVAAVYPENAKSPDVAVRYLLASVSSGLGDRFADSPLSEAMVREELGLAYQKMGDFEEAAIHLERALKIRREFLGDEDPDTLRSLNNVGQICFEQGRYDEAEPFLVKALEGRRRVLGPENPDTIESLCNLGILYLWGADWDRGSKVISEAAEIAHRVLGEEHLVTLKAQAGLIKVHVTESRTAEAEEMVTRSYAISSRVLGDEHEITLYLMNFLVWVHTVEGRHEPAEELGTRAVTIGRDVFGEKHPATMFATSNLGLLYMAKSQYEDAEELLVRSADHARQYLGETHAFAVFFSLRLSVLYNRMRRYDERDALVEKYFAISRKELGEYYPLTRALRFWERKRIERLGQPVNE